MRASFDRLLLAAVVLGCALAHPRAVSAFAHGNLVVTYGGDVREYRTDGSLSRTIPVPFPPGDRVLSGDPLSGVAFDADARLAVYNGANAPWLSVYDAATSGWTHVTLDGWSTHPTGGYGGIACIGRDVFTGDVATVTGFANGLVSFDGDAAYGGRRDLAGFDFSDVTAGPDGRIHALVAGTNLVFVIDPGTLQSTGSVTLEGSVHAIALAPDGTYYGASGDEVRRFTAEGVSYDTLQTAIPGIVDVSVSATGEVAMGTALGELLLCDAELSSAKTILLGGGPKFVTWIPLHATTPTPRTTWGRIKELYRR